MTEGTLETTLLYLSDDGGTPVSARVEAPFRAAFAAEAAPEDILLLTASNVEAVPVTSDRVELRYILHAQVEGLRTEPAIVVTEAAAIPAADVTRDIVLYFTQPGETAWDIARRYRISEEELRDLNPDLSGEPNAGQGLVVWHRSE
jgi:LysM repeat protein